MSEARFGQSQKIRTPGRGEENPLPFFYEGGGRGKTLTQIMHCMRFSPGIILLTGATGSGRSLVLDTLMHNLQAEEADCCYLSEDCAVLETEEELYYALAKGFGISSRQSGSIDELVNQVQRFIAVGLQQKRIVLIAVDDAKQHSLDVLDTLLQLAGGNKGMTVVLTGEPAFVDVIKQFHLRSLLVHQVTVRSLLPEEVFDFVRQYLALHGVSDADLPRRKELDQLISQTGGNLSLLVQALTEWILNRKPTKGGYQSLKLFPWLHVAAIILVVVLTGLAWWFYPREGLKQAEGLHAPEANTIILSDKVPQKIMKEGEERTSGATFPASKVPENNVATEIGLPHQVASQKLPSAQSEVKPMTKLLKEMPRQLEKEGVQASVVSKPVLPEPVLIPINPTEEPLSKKLTPPLLLKNPSRFTLQLANLSSEKSAKDFINGQSEADRDQLSFYTRLRNGKKSFIVIYGDFPSRKAALEENKHMAAKLSQGAPWPRSFREIQLELRAQP